MRICAAPKNPQISPAIYRKSATLLSRKVIIWVLAIKSENLLFSYLLSTCLSTRAKISHSDYLIRFNSMMHFGS